MSKRETRIKKRWFSVTLSAVAAALLLSLSSIAALAQTNRGGIAGTVFDPSHSVVTGATVTITNLGTNQKFTAKTSEKGSYNVQALEPVLYSVTVRAQGFKTATINQVKVDTAETATVDISLLPGSISEEVTVQASVAMINTESGTVATTVTERQLTDIPLVNRSVLDLAMTQPNVMGDVGSEDPSINSSTTAPGYNISVNGGRPGSTQFLSDGVNNTGVSLARTVVSFSPETVQEFAVQSSAFSAEYGNTGGGVINTTTKSGTNELHGSALWYVRNPYFDAPAYVAMPAGTSTNAKPTGASLKYNQFAFTAGGPVYIPKVYNGKNKTFWFFGFEPRFRRDFRSQYTILPTTAMRNGDFSNTMWVYQTAGSMSGSHIRIPTAVFNRFGDCTKQLTATCLYPYAADPNIYQHYTQVQVNGVNQLQLMTRTGATFPQWAGNIIPKQYMNASAVAALKYVAPYGGDNSWFLDSDNDLQNFYNPRLLKQDDKRYTVRIDHNFSQKDLLNWRYTATPVIKNQTTPQSELQGTASYSWAKQMTIAHTHLFTPSVYNDLRLNYTRGVFSGTNDPKYDTRTGQNVNTILGLPAMMKGGIPGFKGPSYISSQGSGAADDIEERYGITDTVYISKGNMTWKLGVDLSHALQNITPTYAGEGGIYDFRQFMTNQTAHNDDYTGGDVLASFLTGVPNSTTFRPALMRYYYRWNSLASFVQNDWKVRPNLTLNLGLRYNLNLPRTEKYNHQGMFVEGQDTTVPIPSQYCTGSKCGVYVVNPTTTSAGVWVPLNSITVPTYEFVGKGGRSRYMLPAHYRDFEPRFGFAWSPSLIAKYHLTMRGGYGISHLPANGVRRLPDPDYSSTASYNTGVDPNYSVQMGVNNPNIVAMSADDFIYGNIPSDGIVNYTGSQAAISSINMADIGFLVSSSNKSPYVQNWNLTLSWKPASGTTVEVSYVGNKGTHLYSGSRNSNNTSTAEFNSYLESLGVDPNVIDSNFRIIDPLNRKPAGTTKTCTVTANPNPADPSAPPYQTYSGTCLQIAPSALNSQYLGLTSLYYNFDTDGSSIRHAGYVNVVYRNKKGWSINSNYTFSKSIDNGTGPDSGQDLTTVGRNMGQAALGAPRSSDRSVSQFDQKHVWNTTVIYDLPFGRNGRFLTNTWTPINAMLEGWTLSGISRVLSGYPAYVSLSDNNGVGDSSFTHTIRPDIVPGVPLKNPNFDPHCAVGTNCQPFLNPAAFQRPALGSYGNAPRTLDSVRGPWMRFFDGSIQKSFKLGEGKRRLQFRMDLLNAFNHPVFRVGPNSSYSDLTGSVPVSAWDSTTVCLTSCNGAAASYRQSINFTDYNSWAAYNNQPQVTTSNQSVTIGGKKSTYTVVGGEGLAIYKQINDMVNAQRNGFNALPANFFSVPVASPNFVNQPANSFDIRTLDGYKQFRLRNAYKSTFGTLYVPGGSSRYIQFGVKLFF